MQAEYKGTGAKRWMERRKGSQLECTEINTSTAARVKKERIVLERDKWSKTGGKQGGNGQDKRGKLHQRLLEL